MRAGGTSRRCYDEGLALASSVGRAVRMQAHFSAAVRRRYLVGLLLDSSCFTLVRYLHKADAGANSQMKSRKA